MATPSALPAVIVDNIVGIGEALLPYAPLLPPIAIGVVTTKLIKRQKRMRKMPKGIRGGRKGKGRR